MSRLTYSSFHHKLVDYISLIISVLFIYSALSFGYDALATLERINKDPQKAEENVSLVCFPKQMSATSSAQLDITQE